MAVFGHMGDADAAGEGREPRLAPHSVLLVGPRGCGQEAAASRWAPTRSVHAAGLLLDPVALVPFQGALLVRGVNALALEGHADSIEQRLRAGDPPVVARVADGHVLIDLRSVLPSEDGAIVAAVRAALA